MEKTIYVIFGLIFAISFIQTNSIFASENLETDAWDDETVISVSILGDNVIDLDTSNRFIRAYVDITNFDPRDGYYFMQIIQPVTGTTVSEEEILIREKSNGEAGADVAYMLHDEDIMVNGTVIRGDYEMRIITEKNEKSGSTTFTLVKGSDSYPSSVGVNENSENSDEEIPPVQMMENIEPENSPSDIEEQTILNSEKSKIPQWVRSIFILYADGNITENELLTALKFLIDQNIIEI